MKELNILWNYDYDFAWENDYINKFLFSKFKCNLYKNVADNNIVIPNSLIVYSCDDFQADQKTKNYLKNYKPGEYYLFHISDEYIKNDCEEYKNAKIVFRNYYNKNRYYGDNVEILPLGWKAGFQNNSGKELKFLKDKKYYCSFIGQPKNDRYELINIIHNVFPQKFIHLTQAFGCKTSLSVEKQIEVYSDSIIVPCPMGNFSVDTFRICEVLESGSIPVIRNYNGENYYNNIFGKNPIPTVNNWFELPNLINELEKYGIDKKIIEINNWYKNYKENLLDIVEKKIS